MRKSKLDMVCAKRLKATDFAQPIQYMPTSNFEYSLIIGLVIALGVLFGYSSYLAYFA